MTDTTITDLPAASAVTPNDVLPMDIAAAGATQKVTMQQLVNAGLRAPGTIGVTTPNAGIFTSVTAASGTVAATPVNPTDIANKNYVDNHVSGGSVTSVAASGGSTGMGFSGSPITSTGTLTLNGTLAVTNGGTGAVTANAALNNLLPAQSGATNGYVLTSDGANTVWEAAGGTGTVTSVAISGGTTGLNSTGGPITSSGTITLGGTLAVSNGGTGGTTPASGLNGLLPTQTGNAGKFLGTDGSGNVSWQPGGGGTVTSVDVSAGTTGLTFTGGPVTASGTITAGGTLAVASGGTGGNTAQAARNNILPTQLTYAGNVLTTDGTNCTWAPVSAGSIAGLGTMAQQNAGAVAITGGTINDAAIGGTTPNTGDFTDLTASGAVSGAGFDAYLSAPPAIGGTTPNSGNFTAVNAVTGTVSNAPVNSSDIANKSYVDSVAVGLQPKAASAVLAASNITLSGLQTIDGYTTIAGDRVCVTGQAAPEDNGIYVAASGAWVRSADANTWAELVGASTFILNGSTYLGSTWVCDVSAGGTLGFTAVTFVEFSQAVTYSAGTGLTLASTTFSISNTGVTAGAYGGPANSATLLINAQGQVTAASNTAISISKAQVSGLGTMASQNSTAINVTGGSIEATTIGSISPSTGAFTTLSVSGSVGGTGITALLASPSPIGSTSANSGAFTTLSASGTVSGSGFSTYLASPPAIGGTAAAAGSFTNLAASGTVSGAGFTAYLASPPAIGSTAASSGAFTTLSASSTVSGAGFTSYLASPPSIGTTAPAQGYFTNLGASGTFTDGSSSVGSTGQALLSTGTGTVWGNPDIADNLAGGTPYSVPYQSAADTTTFLPISSTVGSALISNGTGVAPSWGVPANATSLAGGAIGSIPYQSATDATTFLAAGTSGNLLTSGGAGAAPSWSAPATVFGSLLSSPSAIGNVAPNTGAFTNLSATGSISGNSLTTTAGAVIGGSASVGGGITATQSGTSGSPVFINSTNTRGGTGYAEQVWFFNGNSGATNPNKFLRMDSVGSLQILNSAYTNQLLSISDSGVIGIGQGTSTTYNLTLNGQSEIWDDGNLHIQTASPNVWLDATSGVRIGFNGGATLVVAPTIGNSFASFVSTPPNSGANTAKSLDNLNCQLVSAGGSTLQPQISAVAGSFSCYTTGYFNKAGQNLTAFTNSAGTTISAGTWTNLPGLTTSSPDGRPSSGGDMVQAHITDNTNNRVYRVTYIHGSGTTQGFISIERLA